MIIINKKYEIPPKIEKYNTKTIFNLNVKKLVN